MDYWSVVLAGLPNSESRNFENIHILTCSDRLSSLDIAIPLVEDFKRLESGVVVYDAYLMCEVLVSGSELVNHLGSRAKRFCRKCMVSFI